MRDSGRPIEKEWLILVVSNEFQSLVGNQVRGILIALESLIANRIVRVLVLTKGIMGREGRIIQVDGLIIVPKIGWVEIVSHRLAIIAKPPVDSLPQRIPARTWTA